jgi:hypothetical protein
VGESSSVLLVRNLGTSNCTSGKDSRSSAFMRDRLEGKNQLIESICESFYSSSATTVSLTMEPLYLTGTPLFIAARSSELSRTSFILCAYEFQLLFAVVSSSHTSCNHFTVHFLYYQFYEKSSEKNWSVYFAKECSNLMQHKTECEYR